jgi:hypothetical protein
MPYTYSLFLLALIAALILESLISNRAVEAQRTGR